jgi:hypothetical protein
MASPPACATPVEPIPALDSLLIPFRSQPPSPRLPEGYRLLDDPHPPPEVLNRLLTLMGDRPRSPARWLRVLECSLWHFGVADASGSLNANLWDLCADPGDPEQPAVMLALVQAALARLRRELGGCSVSLSAPAGALAALEHHGFVVDPGGIRAMGLRLLPP